MIGPLTVDANNMPPNWGSAAMSFHNYVFNQVYLKFPCLQLCQSDWKVSQIAGTTYLSWKSHGKQKTKVVKDELGDVKIQDTEDLNPTSGDESARAATPPEKRPFVPEATVSKSPKRPHTEASVDITTTSSTSHMDESADSVTTVVTINSATATSSTNSDLVTPEPSSAQLVFGGGNLDASGTENLK
jgi:hypothetical protein